MTYIRAAVIKSLGSRLEANSLLLRSASRVKGQTAMTDGQTDATKSIMSQLRGR